MRLPLISGSIPALFGPSNKVTERERGDGARKKQRNFYHISYLCPSFTRISALGQRGLARQPVTVWVYEGTLKLEYQAVTLSKYRVELLDDHKHIKEVSNPRLAETVFRSPQLTLFDLGPDEWILYWKDQPYARRSRKRRASEFVQPVLFEIPLQKKAVGAETAQVSLRLILSQKNEEPNQT